VSIMLVAVIVTIMTVALVAFLGRRRRTIPPPDVLCPDTVEGRIAVHEAGHAVAAWGCTIVQNVELVAIDGPDGGFVKFNTCAINSSDRDWCEAVLMLAGVAAEVAVWGKVRTGGAKDDLLKAREKVQGILGMGDDHAPWRRKPIDPCIPFDAMYYPVLSDAEHRALANAYLHAKNIVRSHGRSYYKLVSALMSKRRLNEAEVADILPRRSFLKIVGMMRPTFITP